MKKLIALWLIFFNAGCASNEAATADRIMHEIDSSLKVSKENIKEIYERIATVVDTIPSSILISHKPPSFGHNIDGYCIYQGDRCTGKHLRYWHRQWLVIGPEYTVWGCKRRAAK